VACQRQFSRHHDALVSKQNSNQNSNPCETPQVDFFEIELIFEPIQICCERLVTPPLLLPAVSASAVLLQCWGGLGPAAGRISTGIKRFQTLYFQWSTQPSSKPSTGGRANLFVFNRVPYFPPT
jgi:hypothetical protein